SSSLPLCQCQWPQPPTPWSIRPLSPRIGCNQLRSIKLLQTQMLQDANSKHLILHQMLAAVTNSNLQFYVKNLLQPHNLKATQEISHSSCGPLHALTQGQHTPAGHSHPPHLSLFMPLLAFSSSSTLTSSYPTNTNTPPEWTPSDGSSTAGGCTHEGSPDSVEAWAVQEIGDCECAPPAHRAALRPGSAASAQSMSGLKPPASISTSPSSASMSPTTTYQMAHTGTCLRQSSILNITSRNTVYSMCSRRASNVSDVLVHMAGRTTMSTLGGGDITNNGRAQQHTCAHPPKHLRLESVGSQTEFATWHRYPYRRAGQHMGDGWGSGGSGRMRGVGAVVVPVAGEIPILLVDAQCISLYLLQ
ncbi:hypothetical protein K438DRAFT_2077018, partial [Mycena galopus ATCC 62051]